MSGTVTAIKRAVGLAPATAEQMDATISSLEAQRAELDAKVKDAQRRLVVGEIGEAAVAELRNKRDAVVDRIEGTRIRLGEARAREAEEHRARLDRERVTLMETLSQSAYDAFAATCAERAVEVSRRLSEAETMAIERCERAIRDRARLEALHAELGLPAPDVVRWTVPGLRRHANVAVRRDQRAKGRDFLREPSEIEWARSWPDRVPKADPR